jgi:hypothetical protein
MLIYALFFCVLVDGKPECKQSAADGGRNLAVFEKLSDCQHAAAERSGNQLPMPDGRFRYGDPSAGYPAWFECRHKHVDAEWKR